MKQPDTEVPALLQQPDSIDSEATRLARETVPLREIDFEADRRRTPGRTPRAQIARTQSGGFRFG
jgi:hypothetical protein